MGAVSSVWGKRLIIDRMKAAGFDKNPSLINEDNLKDIFKIEKEGRLFIRENSRNRLEAMVGFELLKA